MSNWKVGLCKSHKTFDTFEELKTCLEDTCVKSRSVWSLQIEFNKCKQGLNETIKDYAFSLQTILRHSTDAAIKMIKDLQRTLALQNY